MLQNATHLRKSAPWPPNISDEHVFCTAPATQNASFKILFKGPTPAIVFRNATKPSRFAHFWQGAQSFAPATRKHIWAILNVQKCSEPIIFLHFDFDMCFAASRHNGVHFFDISSSKSGPDLVCFVHFDFEMCFAPQRRALFQHRHFQKWSGHGVPCTFWLRNVLRTTTRALFRHRNFQKWSGPGVFCIHFDFEMCFTPQRRALFRDLNFQKWSGAGVFCTFWLRNVLRATTACNFSSLI